MYGQHLPPGGFLHPCSHLAPALLQALTLGEGGAVRPHGRAPVVGGRDWAKITLHVSPRAASRAQASLSPLAVSTTLCYLFQGDWSPGCLTHPFYFI